MTTTNPRPVSYEDSDVGPLFGYGDERAWHLVSGPDDAGCFVTFTLDVDEGTEHSHEAFDLYGDALDEAKRRASDDEEPTIVGEAYCPECDDDHEYGTDPHGDAEG